MLSAHLFWAFIATCFDGAAILAYTSQVSEVQMHTQAQNLWTKHNFHDSAVDLVFLAAIRLLYFVPYYICSRKGLSSRISVLLSMLWIALNFAVVTTKGGPASTPTTSSHAFLFCLQYFGTQRTRPPSQIGESASIICFSKF